MQGAALREARVAPAGRIWYACRSILLDVALDFNDGGCDRNVQEGDNRAGQVQCVRQGRAVRPQCEPLEAPHQPYVATEHQQADRANRRAGPSGESLHALPADAVQDRLTRAQRTMEH